LHQETNMKLIQSTQNGKINFIQTRHHILVD